MADGPESSDTPNIFGTFIHKGIRWPNIMLASSIDAIPTFDVRPDDIWVVTYPKSGTHWMMLADGYPEKIDRVPFEASLCMINVSRQGLPATRAEEKERPLDMTPFLEQIKRAPSPRLIWTHLPLTLLPPNLTKRAKVIYLARNPKDVLTSMYDFYSRTPILKGVPFGAMHEQFIQEDIIWGSWFDHVHDFWTKRTEENILFCFYEDMIKSMSVWVGRIADHIGRPLSTDALQRVTEHSSFAGMKQTYNDTEMKAPFTAATFGRKQRIQVSFLNKGKYGRWKNRFTVAQNEEFDAWFYRKTAGTDLEFTFQ